MATTTPNFGWSVPTSTDLVKDGATAIETLGDAIDASLVDLKGGTTGQVLSKNSNTDMDFTWVTDAAGDITGVTAGTGITGGGTSGSVTVSFDQANFGGAQGAAGKNKIINGDMNIWQRGTSFSTPADASYLNDRFFVGKNGNATYTVSRQAATYGAITGYEPNYYCRFAISSIGTTTAMEYHQRIEDVTTLAGQTVTMSFWAKADASRALTVTVLQFFGSGGSSLVQVVNAASVGNATTSWQRFTYSFSMPQITGKTVGAGNFVDISINMPASALTIDFWGVQLEAGSTATPFQTASGSIEGELALCQRYFQLIKTGQAWGTWYSTTDAALMASFPVAMRATPTATYGTPYTNAITEIGVTDRTPTAYASYKTSSQAFSFLATGMTTSATIRQGAVYIGPDHQLSAEL
jgi:hypothetical protein